MISDYYTHLNSETDWAYRQIVNPSSIPQVCAAELDFKYTSSGIHFPYPALNTSPTTCRVVTVIESFDLSKGAHNNSFK